MRFSFLLIILSFVVCGCSKVAVTTDYDQSVDFSLLKTYSWLKTDKGPGDDVRVADPKVDGWVRAAVDKILIKKGFRPVPVENDSSDFLIAWFGAIETKVKQASIDHFYSTYGYGPVGAKMPEKFKEGGTIREYEEGTLVLDFLSTKTKRSIWQGRSTDTLRKGMSEKEAELYIERLITQMLKTLPKS